MVGSLAGLRVLLVTSVLWGIRNGAWSLDAPRILGLRLEDPGGSVCMKERIISAPEGATFQLRLFGTNLNESGTQLAFAAAEGVVSSPDSCEERQDSAFQVEGQIVQDEQFSWLLTVSVKRGSTSNQPRYYRLCVEGDTDQWAPVGPDRLRVSDRRDPEYIPPWGLAVLVVVLLLVCGLLRTVNLSLLWLDPVELYVLHSCGTEEEKRAAKRLEPVRRRGNFLVSSRDHREAGPVLDY